MEEVKKTSLVCQTFAIFYCQQAFFFSKICGQPIQSLFQHDKTNQFKVTVPSKSTSFVVPPARVHRVLDNATQCSLSYSEQHHFRFTMELLCTMTMPKPGKRFQKYLIKQISFPNCKEIYVVASYQHSPKDIFQGFGHKIFPLHV